MSNVVPIRPVPEQQPQPNKWLKLTLPAERRRDIEARALMPVPFEQVFIPVGSFAVLADHEREGWVSKPFEGELTPEILNSPTTRIVRAEPPQPRLMRVMGRLQDQHGNPVSVNRSGQYIDGAGRVLTED
jgi:hypothetical protein